MPELYSKSFFEILEKAQSKEPTPGGGSISAMAAALAASMTAMVANLTLGRKKYKDVEEKVSKILERATSIIQETDNLVKEDISAFQVFMEAYRMPQGSDEEKGNKDIALEEAAKKATLAPLKTARACLEILELTYEIAPIGNKMAISDAGVAAYLGEAALGAALLNVDINLPSVKDEHFAKEAKDEKESLLRKAARLKEDALSHVQRRIGS